MAASPTSLLDPCRLEGDPWPQPATDTSVVAVAICFVARRIGQLQKHARTGWSFQ